MVFLLPVVAALMSLVILPGILFYFDVTPKVFVLLFGACVAVIAFMKNGGNVRALVSSRRGRWFVLLLAAQELSLIVATVFSTNPALSLNGGNWRRFGLLTQSGLLVFTLLAADARAVPLLLRTIAGSGAVAALYGVFQYFGIDPFQASSAYHVGEGVWSIVRPPGTMGHADYFGIYLLYVVFSGIAVLAIEERAVWKLVGGAAAILGVIAILLSGTRSAILGLIVGMAITAVLLRPKFRWRQIAPIAGVAAAMIVFYLSPAGVKLRARMRWYREDPRGGARLLLWRDSLRMAAARPLTGYGPEAFTTEFPRFQSLDLARAYPDFYHESPHNIFLDAATGQGMLGLGAFMAFCGWGFIAAQQARRVQPKLAALLTGAFVAALLSQQFASFTLPTAFFFYLTVGMLVCCPALDLKTAPSRSRLRINTSEPRALASGRQNQILNWRPGWPLRSAAVCAAGYLLIYAVHLTLADHALASVKRAFDSGNAEGAIAAYQQVEVWQPAGSSADLYYSRSMTRLHRQTEAFAAGLRAIGTAEDRQNAYYNLAELSAVRNDATGVERNLRAAIACAPAWFKPHWALARLLIAYGRLDEAQAEALAAVERDGGKDAEVTQTLQQVQRLENRTH